MMRIRINIKSISLQADKHYNREQFKRALYGELTRLMAARDATNLPHHESLKYGEAQVLLPTGGDDSTKMGTISAGLIYKKINRFIQ
jgi:hypothetical protein